MVVRTKEILREAYIGPIIIAILWADAVRSLVAFTVGPLQFTLYKLLEHSNVNRELGRVDSSLWWLGLVKVIQALILFAAGYLLATWIFSSPDLDDAEEAAK